MKSPLRKLRGFGLNQNRNHNNNSNDSKSNVKKKARTAPSQLDELRHAAMEVQEMRNCYDSLLSAAAATANSVYEFSEALDEMGSCWLEKTALNDDDDSGRVLMLIGKAQFELQELVDTYRANIIHTITTPSESLLKELQTVEEMKRQCDDKRDYYKYVVASYREKGFRPKNVRTHTENFSSDDVQAALQDYEDEAALFIFRLKSLQQGQFRSLLTQAARHHAAQLSFFRRGLKHLEALEPHVKKVAEQQHIDYQFSGLNDETDEESDIYDDEESDDNSFSDNEYNDNNNDDVGRSYYHSRRVSHDGELSFDYNRNINVGMKERDVSFPPRSRNLTEMDYQIHQASPMDLLKERPQQENLSASFRPKPNLISQSAPLFANPQQTHQLDPFERFRNMRPSSTRKLHSYALPVPDDSKTTNPNSTTGTPTKTASSIGITNTNTAPSNQPKVNNPIKPNVYHSSPLPKEYCHNYNKLPINPNPNSKSGPLKMPPQNIRRDAFSGPIHPKPNQPKPATSSHNQSQPQSQQKSPSPKLPPPRTASSPQISELHELPRPPSGLSGPVQLPVPLRPSQLVGYSGPLVSKRQVAVPTPRASPLPTPPQAAQLSRSFSIPSSTTSQRVDQMDDDCDEVMRGGVQERKKSQGGELRKRITQT